MRCHVKKKRYKQHVREQIRAGQHSMSNGQWSTVGSTAGVNKNCYEGCMGAEPGVGRPKKGGSVKPKPEIFAEKRY